MTCSARLAGVPVAAVGLSVAYIASTYPVGTLARMGPGFVPLWIGIALAALGLLIFLFDTETVDEELTVSGLVRPGIMVFAALLLWGIMIVPWGLVPATFALVIVSAFARSRPKIVETLILAAAVTGFGYLVFAIGLNLRVTAFGV